MKKIESKVPPNFRENENCEQCFNCFWRKGTDTYVCIKHYFFFGNASNTVCDDIENKNEKKMEQEQVENEGEVHS